MKKEDVDIIISDINAEGFDYALVHYSDYSEIRHREFHKLRKAFLKAREILSNFLDKEANKYDLELNI